MSSLRKPPSLLNKQRIEGHLWLAADIHLGPHAPKTAAAFYAFLTRAAREADALILCGDIFEAWIGDDVIFQPSPWLQEAIAAFRQCSAQIPLFLMRGNRDFLLGNAFARHIQARWLPDEVLIETAATTFLLAHGDQLCTQDRGYQRYRAIVHHPWVQKLFLTLPLRLRAKIARSLRQRSQNKPYHMMDDIHEPTALDWLQQHDLTLLVHGHTHQPAIHLMDESTGLRRIVIPDWEYDHSTPVRGGWLSLSTEGQLELHQSSQATQICPLSSG